MASRVGRAGDSSSGLRGAARYAAPALGLVPDALMAARVWEPPGKVFQPCDRHAAHFREATDLYKFVRDMLVLFWN